MVGISDYGPVVVPKGAIELRIHGVSGTPADALLKAPPVLIAGTTTAGFYRTSPSSQPMTAESPGVREAYAWGGLTAGTRITSALRLLLLPFSLVNVAGWMLPGVTDEDGAPTRPKMTPGVGRRAAAHALVSRLLALCLTAYATLGATWLATITIERALRRYSVAILEDGQAQARVILLAVLLLIATWVFVSRRQALAVDAPAPGAMARAPVTAPARRDFDVSMLWDGSSVAQRLSGIHAAFAIASVAILTDAALGESGGIATVTPVVAWIALALATLGLFAFAWNNPVGRALTTIVRLGAVPLALAAAALALLPRESSLEPSDMVINISKGLQFGMAFLAVAVFVLVLAQVFVGPTGGHLAGRLYASAFTVIGFGTAITAIAGLAEILTRLVPDENATEFIPGTAQTIAVLGLVSCSVAAIVVLLRFNPAQGVTTVPWFKRLRDTTAHARTAIVTGACVFAVGANVLAVTYFLDGRVLTPDNLGDEEPGWATWGWLVIAGVVAAIFSARLSSWGLRIVATAGGAVVLTLGAWYGAAIAWAWVGDDSVADAADTILDGSERWFVVAAVTAALVTPMTAVIGYMWRGSKDQTTRRLVGVLWDLVTFWPRQFHPWAPPPYTDTTIPELAGRVQSLAANSGANSVTISAHSQGAIIAVPALGRLKAQGFEPGKDGVARVCLLTYGQLLDSHYRWLFPWIFNPYLFREIDEYLDGRWMNLYRVTDPLGQPVPAIGAVDASRDIEISEGLELDLGPTTRPKTLNHGDYWYSSAIYQAATDRLAQP
jgi:hypothetical protein